MDLFVDNAQSAGVGYRWLIDTYDLRVMPNWHVSLVAPGNIRRTNTEAGRTTDAYPVAACPTATLGGHLEFALKNDGTNLEIFSALFAAIDPAEVTAYVASRPTGRYARRVWYLYELLTGRRLRDARRRRNRPNGGGSQSRISAARVKQRRDFSAFGPIVSYRSYFVHSRRVPRIQLACRRIESRR